MEKDGVDPAKRPKLSIGVSPVEYEEWVAYATKMWPKLKPTQAWRMMLEWARDRIEEPADLLDPPANSPAGGRAAQTRGKRAART